MPNQSSLRHVQKQEQKISTSMIHGLNMLTVPSAAMYDYLVELAIGNPMLEIPDAAPQGAYESLGGGTKELFHLDRGRDPGYYDRAMTRPDPNEDEETLDPYYSAGEVFSDDTLAGSLELQLSMCRLGALEEAVGREILGNLDESGYFAGDLNTICLLYCCDISVGERVLKTIQGFTPRGIAARDVYEALSLQVDDDFEYAVLARRIINENLAAVSEKAAAACAKKYKVSEKIIREVFDYIKMLEPRPGNCCGGKFNISYITPDIVVREEQGALSVYVSGDNINPLRVNEDYLELIKAPELTSEDRQYLRSSLNAARALIHSVDIRRQTLHRLALALVSVQGDFFRFGEDALKPLSMQQLADAMGVNVSTVSRAAQDKYVSCAWGTYPIKYFFARNLRSTDSGVKSSVGAKQLIEQLIEQEDSQSPLTDEQLEQKLRKAGYVIARRTVTKYRQAAGIPGCIDRRRVRRA